MNTEESEYTVYCQHLDRRTDVGVFEHRLTYKDVALGSFRGHQLMLIVCEECWNAIGLAVIRDVGIMTQEGLDISVKVCSPLGEIEREQAAHTKVIEKIAERVRQAHT